MANTRLEEIAQLKLDIGEIRRQHQQEADEWTTDEQLSAEREKVSWCEVHRPIKPVDICPACECVHLSDQLETIREKQGALPYDELESLYRGTLKQLAAEREKMQTLVDGIWENQLL